MSKRFTIALLMFLLLSTYNIQGNFSIKWNSNFLIKKITIKNNLIVSDQEITKKLLFLYDKNILFLKSKSIEEKLKEIEIIDSFHLKRIFPNQIIIRIFEKKPIAIIQNKNEKKFYTLKGDLISFFNFREYKDLPIVFGDNKSFKKFYSVLKKLEIPISDIEKFYLFESKRWDIVTKDDKTIKLPIEKYEQSLKNFLNIRDKENFKKYKIFDYRINDQLILK